MVWWAVGAALSLSTRRCLVLSPVLTFNRSNPISNCSHETRPGLRGPGARSRLPLTRKPMSVAAHLPNVSLS